MAFEELGPTFVKLGQILSTRYDIVPIDITNELSKLQDNVAEFELDFTRLIFNEELGVNIEDVFASFDDKPIAAASIGQVYRGTLCSGEKVVVKIQRPNIKNLIDRDIDILLDIAVLIDDHLNREGPVKAAEIINEFSYFIKKEIDYTYEGQNCEKFNENFKGDSRVVIPKIFWKYTTKKVLVMEEIEGVRLSNINEIERYNWDKGKISEVGARVFMEQIFIHGYFHGDPHPGNIFLLGEDKIAFIDFGIVGYIDKNILDFIITLLRNGKNKDINRIIMSLTRLEIISQETNEINLRKDLYYLLNYYFNIPLNKINLGEAFSETLIIANRHRLKIPSQLILLIKALITMEGTGKKLNPSFNLSSISESLLKDLAKRQLNPSNIINDIIDIGIDNYNTLKELPRQVNSILNKLERNELKFSMKQEGLRRVEKEINVLTNKLSLSLLVSALIVGSSVVIRTNIEPKILGISAFGLIGYIIGAVLGLYLVMSILLNSWNNRNNN